MRVVLYTPCYPPDIASYAQLIEDLSLDLSTAGHEVVVVSSTTYGKPGYIGHRFWKREKHGDIEVLRVNTFPTARKSLLLKSAGFVIFTLMSFLIGLFTERPDVIFAASTPPSMGLVGGFVAKLRRACFVYNVQDIFPDVAIKLGVLKSPLLIRGALWMERASYRLCDVVTVIGPDLAAVLRSKGVPSEKLVVVPNWVDTDVLNRPSRGANAFLDEQGLQGKFIVLYAGNFGLSQGLEVVLKAARGLQNLTDLVFILVGDGQTRPTIEAHLKAQGPGNVRLLPFQPRERLAELFGGASVGVVPLKRGLSSDSVPSKTWSMMAARLPIVASIDTNSALARFVREQGVGLVTEPESAEELASAICELYRDPQRLQQMGDKARRYAEEHLSRRVSTTRYNHLFESLRGRGVR
ncbi:MAG: glycosyltransferase family 4 protein [Bacillota bacterium]